MRKGNTSSQTLFWVVFGIVAVGLLLFFVSGVYSPLVQPQAAGTDTNTAVDSVVVTCPEGEAPNSNLECQSFKSVCSDDDVVGTEVDEIGNMVVTCRQKVECIQVNPFAKPVCTSDLFYTVIMEENGLIGPGDGAKAREIYIDKDPTESVPSVEDISNWDDGLTDDDALFVDFNDIDDWCDTTFLLEPVPPSSVGDKCQEDIQILYSRINWSDPNHLDSKEYDDYMNCAANQLPKTPEYLQPDLYIEKAEVCYPAEPVFLEEYEIWICSDDPAYF